MFGTFADEEEKVVYGLTHPVRTFDITYLQVAAYVDMYRRIRSKRNWSEKWAVVWCGPGWDTGKPRLGNIEDIPDLNVTNASDGGDDIERYDPISVPFVMQLYCAVHFLLVILFHVFMAERCVKFSQMLTLELFAFIFLSLTSFGALMDGKSYATALELARCVTYFALDSSLLPGFGAVNLFTSLLIKSIFAGSLFVWIVQFAQQAQSKLQLSSHEKKRV